MWFFEEPSFGHQRSYGSHRVSLINIYIIVHWLIIFLTAINFSTPHLCTNQFESHKYFIKKIPDLNLSRTLIIKAQKTIRRKGTNIKKNDNNENENK